VRLLRHLLRRAAPALVLASVSIAAVMGSAAPASAAPTADDSAFLTYNAQMTLTELALGDLALQRAQSPAVRALGQEAVDQHTALRTTLEPLAAGLGIALPTAPSDEQRAAYAMLAASAPADFDATFLQLQIAWNQKAIANVNARMPGLGEPAVAAYARQYLAVSTGQLTAANARLWADGDVPSAVPAGSGGLIGAAGSRAPALWAVWAMMIGTALALAAVGLRRIAIQAR